MGLGVNKIMRDWDGLISKLVMLIVRIEYHQYISSTIEYENVSFMRINFFKNSIYIWSLFCFNIIFPHEETSSWINLKYWVQYKMHQADLCLNLAWLSITSIIKFEVQLCMPNNLLLLLSLLLLLLPVFTNVVWERERILQWKSPSLTRFPGGNFASPSRPTRT